AIREACGDFLLPNPETITLVIPEFVTAIPPVSEDIVNIVSIVGEANTADTTSAKDIVAYNTTENTRTTENTETTEITETTEKTPKSKRRTQAGFNRKVEEWHKILDNLNSENYEVLIAQVGDDLGFWTDGTKFVFQEVTEKLQEAIEFWSANSSETLETSSTESNTESNDVNAGIETQDEIKSFLNRLDAENLSESGLGDLQEEIRLFFGLGNIPQLLLDATFVAWERLDQAREVTEDLESLVNLIEEINENYSAPSTEVEVEVEVYTGDVPEDQELSSYEDDNDDDNDEKLNNQKIQDNLDWQEAILSCNTLECLKEWEASLAQTTEQVPNSVLPETLGALRVTREKLEQDKAAADTQNQIDEWSSRAEMAFDLQEVQTIYDEIRESGIMPSMELIKIFDASKIRLTPVAKPEPTLEEAKESISNSWGTPPATTSKNKNPFAGKRTQVQKEVVEEVTADNDHVSISSINTSGVFAFKSLESLNHSGTPKMEHHNRFDAQYILEPGTKVYEPSTGFVFEVITWEQAKFMSPLVLEDTNKLPLKSLHSPTRSYPKTARTEDLMIVSDSLATQLVANYKKQISEIDKETPMIGS
ncbi:MAG: hypothetical protein ACKPBB_12245, partial [Sphaerospermopsis kisseleviana]